MDPFDGATGFKVHHDEVPDDVEMDVQVDAEVLNESQDDRADEVLQTVTEAGLQQLLQIKSKAIVESKIEKDTYIDFLKLSLANAHNKVANLEEKINYLSERNSQIKQEEIVEIANFKQLESVIDNTKFMLKNLAKTCKQDEHTENMLKETSKKLKDEYMKQRSTYIETSKYEISLDAADEEISQLNHTSSQNKRQYEEYRVERENMVKEKSDEYHKNALSYEKMQSDYVSLQNFCATLKTKTEKDKIEYSERETQLDKIRSEIKDAQTFSNNKQEEMNQTLIVLKEQCDSEFKRLNSLEITNSKLEEDVKKLVEIKNKSKQKVEKLESDHTICLKELNDLNKSLDLQKQNQEQISKKYDKNLQLKEQIQVVKHKYENLITLQVSQQQQKTMLLNSIENTNGEIARINNNKADIMLEVVNLTENLKKSSELEKNLLAEEKQVQQAFHCSKHKLNLKNAEYEIHCQELEMKRNESASVSSKLNNSNNLKKETLKNKFNNLRITALSNLKAINSKYQKEKDDLLEQIELISSQMKNDETEIQRLEVKLNEQILTNADLVREYMKLGTDFEMSQNVKTGILKSENTFTVPTTSKNVSFKPTISFDSYSDSFESIREDLKSTDSEEIDLKQTAPASLQSKGSRINLSPPEKDK